MIQEIKEIAETLNVSDSLAADIMYLRTRNRWTQTLEDELIRLHSTGVRPNMCEFGCTRETGEALLAAALS